jgi:NAD+ kinase
MDDQGEAMTIKRMGVLAHPTRPHSAPLADQIAAALRARGVAVWAYHQWDEATVNEQIAGTDMVVAIGGDGAMLRVSRVCAPRGVPVLGVNLGHLGFLTEIKNAEEWDARLEALFAGDYWIERRMMVKVTARRDGELLCEAHALNDAVISRGSVTRMIRLDTYIDGYWTTTYNADALILSTPTGSTAYALASGGPILPPEMRGMLIVPVAPHLSLDRPIVLPEGALIEVIVSPDIQADTVLSVDGTLLCELQSHDRVLVQAGIPVSQFVRMRDRNYFYRSLLDRLEPRAPDPPAPPRRHL